MGRKRYAVIEILDIFRRYQSGDSVRRISKATGVARNTVTKYIEIAEEHGFSFKVAGGLDDISAVVFNEIHGGGESNRRLYQ
ncbi:MAG: helix-turn-helix domain-containing protein [Nitrospirae bacterium]|nr:helix-turn-helix domain-containing protein [Nitrospirota bacterium]